MGDETLPSTGDAFHVIVTPTDEGADPLHVHGFRRCKSEHGFTLIELLIVLVIIGILMTIAVPSYLGYRQRAIDTTAKQNIRAASAAAESYRADNTGQASDVDGSAATSGYQGMTTARLRLYDRGIKTALTVYATKTTVTAFCLRITISSRAWSALGPGLVPTSYKNNTTCT